MLVMTLYYLKDQGSLRMTCKSFGISPPTLSTTIRQVCNAISKGHGPKLIKCPDTKDRMETLMSKVEEKCGFPMVLGCVDGTHIPIKQPHENAHAYLCYKMKYSINVQAVCDHEGCFIDVDCSWPGSVHDAKIFSNSSINKLFQEQDLSGLIRKLTDNDETMVGSVLLGDPAYPLLPGMLHELSTCASDGEVIFNMTLRSVRNHIECTFGWLKARWRILNRPIDLGIEFVLATVYACFVLHNYCESVKASVSQEAINKEIKEMSSKQDCSHHSSKDKLYTYKSARGMLIRESVKNYFEYCHRNQLA